MQPYCLSIGLYFVSGAYVTGSAMVSGFTTCIEALYSSGVHVGDSMLMSDGWGIWLYHCTDSSVDSCIVNGGFTAANVQYSQNVSVSLSMISGVSSVWGTVSGDGVYSYHTTDLRVCDNLIVSCVHGVLATASANLTVEANEVVSCGVGVSLNSVDDGNARVTDNNITGCAWYGVQLSSCQGVGTYHNGFSDNAVQAFDGSPGDNSWDDGYPSGGNHWSDYAGVDTSQGEDQDVPGPDGIGDAPYVFSEASDRYPLMHPLWMDAPPSAWLTVGPSSALPGQEFQFDASLTYDREDPPESVQVRWDWDGDLEWDTGWSTDKNAEHSYAAPGEYSVSVEAMDGAGQTDLAEVTVTVLEPDVDEDAPVLVAEVSGIEGSDGWFTSAVEISIEATDGESGVLLTEYRVVDSVDWTEYEDGAEFSEDGVWSLEARSIDLAGNLAEEEVSFKLDATAPVTALALNGTVVTLEAEDATSGVASTWYRVDGGELALYETPFEVVGEGEHIVEYYTVDVAGNEEDARNVTLTVDAETDDDGPTLFGFDWTFWSVLMIIALLIMIAVPKLFGMRRAAKESSSKAAVKDIGTAVAQMADDTGGPPPDAAKDRPLDKPEDSPSEPKEEGLRVRGLARDEAPAGTSMPETVWQPFDIEYARGLPNDLREGIALNSSSFSVIEESWATDGAQEFPFGIVVLEEDEILHT